MLEPHAGYLHFGAAIQVAFRSHVLGGSCQITPPSDFFCSCRIENVVAAAATATALGGGTFQPPGLAQGQTGDRKRGVGPVVKLQDRDQHAGPPPRSQGKGGRLRRPRLGRLRAFPGCPHRRPGRSFRVASAKKKHATPPAGAGPGAAANTVPSLPALQAGRPGRARDPACHQPARTFFRRPRQHCRAHSQAKWRLRLGRRRRDRLLRPSAAGGEVAWACKPAQSCTDSDRPRRILRASLRP